MDCYNFPTVPNNVRNKENTHWVMIELSTWQRLILEEPQISEWFLSYRGFSWLIGLLYAEVSIYKEGIMPLSSRRWWKDNQALTDFTGADHLCQRPEEWPWPVVSYGRRLMGDNHRSLVACSNQVTTLHSLSVFPVSSCMSSSKERPLHLWLHLSWAGLSLVKTSGPGLHLLGVS